MTRRLLSLLLCLSMLAGLFASVSAEALAAGTEQEKITARDDLTLVCNADFDAYAIGQTAADYGEETFWVEEDGTVLLKNWSLDTYRETGIHAAAVAVVGDWLLTAEGKQLCAYTLPDYRRTVVMESDLEIGQFVIMDQMIYFIHKGDIYTQALDETVAGVYAAPGNANFIYRDADTGMLNFQTGITDGSVDFSYSIDSRTGEIAPYVADNGKPSSRMLLGHSFTVKVGNVTLPLPEYPDLSFITYSGGPCSGGVGHFCDDCRRYYVLNGNTYDMLAWQCFGFARWVYFRCFGAMDTTGYNAATFGSGSCTTNYLQSIFDKTVKAGAHIRTGNDGHSMAYMGCDSTYVYTYEGNFGNNCQVRTVARTWAEMASYLYSVGGAKYIMMPSNYPASNEHLLDPIVFNVAYYKANNADLSSMTNDQAKNHWLNYGYKEGRCASPCFDVKWYLNNHSDLKSAFGTDYDKAIKHFLDSGVKEGRAGSAQFNFSYYKANYNDLVTAFGTNNYSYYKHYVDYSGSEKRVANRKLVKLVSGVYTLTAKGDSSLNLAFTSNAAGANPTLQAAADQDSQRFAFERSAGDNYYYKIRHLASNLYLCMDNGKIKLASFADNTSFQWLIVDVGDGAVAIANRNDWTNNYFDVANAVFQTGTSVQIWKDNGNTAQKWTMTLRPVLKDGVYTIRSAKDEGYSLDIDAVSKENTANLQIWSNADADNQRFAVYHDKDGYYTIRALHCDKCLDVTNGDKNTGANIAQYTDNGTAAQKWAVIRHASGNYVFVNQNNGWVMDISGGTMANGSNVQCWSYNETPAQQWKLVPVTTGRVNPDGDMLLVSKVDQTFVAEIVDGNVQSGKKTNQMNQVFRFTNLNNGYYAIRTIDGKLIGVADGSVKVSAAANPTTAEMWQLMPHADGSVGIVNAASGLFMNLRGGKAEVADIFAYWNQADAASRWLLEVNPHTHKLTDKITAPTCTEKGYTTHTCSECGAVFSDTYVDALGHDYDVVEKPATCAALGTKTYTCRRCGDSYAEYIAPGWSDWSPEVPTGVEEELIRTRTAYRFRDKDTVTSYSPSLDGYTVGSTRWVQSGTGSVSYVKSWPSGFDKSNSTYTTYNKTAPTASESTTTKRTVGSEGTVGYIYWHWCQGGSYSGSLMNRYINDVKDSTFTTFHAFFSTTSPSSLPSADTVYQCDATSLCKDSYWFFAIPVNSKSYTDYKKEFTHERWGGWSEWSDVDPVASATRQVETRTEYSVMNTSSVGQHTWGKTTVILPATTKEEGRGQHTCSVCGTVEDVTIPVRKSVLKLQTVSVSLKNDLSMNFYITPATVDGWKDVYVQFAKEVYDGNGDSHTEFLQVPIDYDDIRSGSYVFVYPKVSAKEMSTVIDATVYGYREGVLYHGPTMSYSVRDYATATYAVAPATEKGTLLKKTLVNLLNYGAAAQTYMNYNMDDLASNVLTAEQRALVAGQTVTYEDHTKHTGSKTHDIVFNNISLVLGNNVMLKYYLSLGAYTGSIDDLKMVITYGTQKYTIDAADFEKNGNELVITFSGLTAQQMRLPCVAKVYSKSTGAVVSSTLTYSVVSYAKTLEGKTTNLANLTDRMMRYGDTAAAYFNN